MNNFESGQEGGQGFQRATARVRRASSGLSAMVSHWKGSNGGASQGSQDVVMEDGSFHMAATSLNLMENNEKGDDFNFPFPYKPDI